jgi:tripartite-type tricarboxylate transporter receptor subunit TctC
MQAKLKRLAVDPMPMSPEQMDKFIVSELAANERLIKAAGITPK